VVASAEAYWVLQYNEGLIEKFFEQEVETDEEGIEEAFKLDCANEIAECVTSGVLGSYRSRRSHLLRLLTALYPDSNSVFSAFQQRYFYFPTALFPRFQHRYLHVCNVTCTF